VLAAVERAGVRIDSAALQAQSYKVEQELTRLMKEVFEVAGGEFNIGSPKQLAEVLFDKLNLPVLKRTGTSKAPSTAVEVLEELALTHDLTVTADPTRIAQVLGNLLSNAVKFTPVGGKVRIELVRDGGNAVARVIDSGIGIPAGQEDRVFEMFTRILRPGGSPQAGLGIGLALGRRLAAMHGGTLQGHSKGEGHGSTFTLTLPLDQPGQLSPRDVNSAAQAPDPGKAREILVDEDNDDVASILVEWLQERGHRVSVAHTGPDGVRRAQEVQPEIILCDLGLPGLDGFEVCRQIRATPLDRQPVIVALTGWGREADRERTSAAGFDYHLVKPVGSAQLDAVLDGVHLP
jgi:CheY-like chemotaxis protein